jgi:hypothetical protein
MPSMPAAHWILGTDIIILMMQRKCFSVTYIWVHDGTIVGVHGSILRPTFLVTPYSTQN